MFAMALALSNLARNSPSILTPESGKSGEANSDKEK
jgi:hypothetical protein